MDAIITIEGVSEDTDPSALLEQAQEFAAEHLGKNIDDDHVSVEVNNDDNDPWEHSATRTRSIDMARDHPASAARLVANPEAHTQNAWDVLRSAFGRVEAQELVMQHDGGRQALERIGIELVCPHTLQGLPGRTIVSSHRLPPRQFHNPGWMVITKAPQEGATYPNEVYTTHLVVLGESGFYATNGHYDLTADQAFQDFIERCKKEM